MGTLEIVGLSVGNLCMGVVGKIIFDWLKTSKNGKSKNGKQYVNNPIDFHALMSKIDNINIAAEGVPELKQRLFSALTVLSKTDNDGVPLIYTPRKIMEVQQQNNKLQERELQKLDVIIRLLAASIAKRVEEVDNE